MAGFFDTLFGGGAEKEAADRNRQALGVYGPEAQGYLKSSYDTGRTDLGNAIGAYKPLADLATGYNQAGGLFTNALGAGGPAGNAAATAAFQTSPGYQFQFDQGMDALNRRRAAGGMLNSGNADIDAIRFGQGTANQEYQNWLKNLQTAGGMGIQATGLAAQGQGQGYTNLANLAQQLGINQVGVAGNVLSGTMDANKLQAAGEAAGAKNLLGAGTSLLSLAMGMPPGMGSSLFGGGSGSIPGAVGGTSIGGAPLVQPSLFNRMFG